MTENNIYDEVIEKPVKRKIIAVRILPDYIEIIKVKSKERNQSQAKFLEDMIDIAVKHKEL